jgi:[ribosomal protein S5]-alanine N-acetyltransferase
VSDYPRLLTTRLLLRPFEISDAPAVERLAGAREVADTTLAIPHPYPRGGGVDWIATHAEKWEKRSHLALAIVPRSAPGELVGAISLSVSMIHLHAEIGYWIAPEQWGQGYATEASRALITYAFDTLKLHRVEAKHFARNPASGRVMQKLGMRHEGTHRDAYVRWGKFEDAVVYAVLASEWDQRRET